MKKVSVIVPVYNVENYLKECLDSILNQTLKDIELIAVNDGSTDNSLQILQNYKDKYSSVVVIDQVNKGVSVARNIGIKRATGEYLYFLDSDDYLESDALENLYNVSKDNDLDILSFDGKVFFDCKENVNASFFNYSRVDKIESFVMDGESFYNYLKNKNAYKSAAWMNFYKKEFIDLNSLYFEEGIIYEDSLFTQISFVLAQRCMYIPKEYLNRRVREDSIMTKKVSKINFKSTNMVCKRMYEFYITNKNNMNETTRQNIIKNIRYLFVESHFCCNDIDEMDKLEIRNEIKKYLREMKEINNLSLNIQLKYPRIHYLLKNIKVFEEFKP